MEHNTTGSSITAPINTMDTEKQGKTRTNQIIDRLKQVRGRLTKQDDRQTILDAIDHLKRMKATKDVLEEHVKKAILAGG